MSKEYFVIRSKPNSDLEHAGKKGMKWGYNNGKKNGKRTAQDIIDDMMGVDESIEKMKAEAKAKVAKESVDRAKEAYENSNIFNRKEAYEKYRQAEINSVKADLNKTKAQMKYDSTPMGALEIFSNEIKKGSDWLKSKMR